MSRNNLKESSTDDSTIQLYEQLSFSYPALQQPLFNERDTVCLRRSKRLFTEPIVMPVIRLRKRDPLRSFFTFLFLLLEVTI
ncbi:uncharacterized protein LOC114313846 isoform X4 [Camellia sinensis]|uniref:uncharacterized protein LOC114313846 isoform X4 n=1 Tax=Camellia sinensis TaxID=4442 RepID=UPI0010363A54|nr:uncharacterized protein LOC114313846 isoform X4 [Camellia sinensis]XP_028116057.1 uncharacterized protein LOC114313846 isoform X4 [Camellia sinensis]XP_028116058.1 uncharacterized protein LOC114313846 isoform X4 [Camellia sinensis]XP_028116059.1 uncharacterized protein LOC114313846 isoform X4 [Camellia sinensis]XP_028116060.1 uncharacterized protein LOC114313846 isoform X4 [Camellia sinensis]